jgi:uncharacterized cupin superfamily protein
MANWVEITPNTLAGAGLAPYREGEIRNLFDWAENPSGRSVHLMPHRGQLIVDVVEIESNAVHQPSKPGDEVVMVLEGTLTLTNDADRTEQVFQRDEMVLIPAGWAGVYRVAAAMPGRFRELAIVPGNYFDADAAPLPNRLHPRRLDLPTAAGIHELHRNRYVVQAHNAAHESEWTFSGETDQIIRVLAGRVSLQSAVAAADYGPGSVLIVPAGSADRARVESGYRGLHVRWLG